MQEDMHQEWRWRCCTHSCASVCWMGVVAESSGVGVAPREMDRAQSNHYRKRCMHWEVHFDPWRMIFKKRQRREMKGANGWYRQ